ncbi:PAS domain-containing sensor histidine kinase [Phenylobacterium sp. NIBR 498073]|uniref:sensor histidine kinase n=1 Tax=Phenylobacterium sp. NIBR 498073 TaxID=3015177 RepID=UPI0022B31385|nr:PAS domain-containing sensor histidine kinase [Phenylobacterium sp. NIBR 498073]WGU41681.1 HWE histidine kinase domain-containing protein [Phenylobacterium sp. NIBR 498073]
MQRPSKDRDPAPFVVGDSRMIRLVREFDWAATSLGAASGWPPELKTMVNFILESQFPAAIVWGKDLTTIYNDAFLPILGDKPEALGRSFADVWAEVWDQIGPILDRAFAGEATFIKDYPLIVNRSELPEQAWFTFCYSPLRLASGDICGVVDTVVETTATVRAHADVDLLAQEMSHRLKNTMATVQALAAQSLKEVVERSVVEEFLDRIVTLGNAHDVLFRQNWQAVPLRRVAEATLAPIDGLGQIHMKGREVQIGVRTTMTLSLLLHELATNAAKYGALSTPQGRVDLEWGVRAGTFRLRWRECGGPPVRPPAHTGFGSRLIDLGLTPDGSVERRYGAQGVEVDIEAPVHGLLDQ